MVFLELGIKNITMQQQPHIKKKNDDIRKEFIFQICI